MSNDLEVMVETLIRAVARLREGVAKRGSDLERDGVIQRFEYTFELTWKVLKAYMAEAGGVSVMFARDCFREAFRRGLIRDEAKWLDTIRLRNLTSHTYREAVAEEVVRELPELVAMYGDLADSLKERIRADNKSG
jgi:nucleotidyltransferase substrate binding protein (TIGR01987 family)